MSVRFPHLRSIPVVHVMQEEAPLPPIMQVDVDWVRRKWLDVPYATLSPSQKLDLYLPNTGSGPFPVIVNIHGGGFAFGDKRGGELSDLLRPALESGFAVASINYRLSGEAKFPAAIEDVKAAIRYLRANAAEYFLAEDRISLWGSSAGGNLSALAGTTQRMTTFSNASLGSAGVPETVCAVVDFFGPIDFLTMDAQFASNGIAGIDHNAADSFESRYLGAPLQTVPWLAIESDPQTYINPGMPPFFIAHGTRDDQIPYQQSVVFAQNLMQGLPPKQVQLRLVDGAGHGGEQFAQPELLKQVFSFLKQSCEE